MLCCSQANAKVDFSYQRSQAYRSKLHKRIVATHSLPTSEKVRAPALGTDSGVVLRYYRQAYNCCPNLLSSAPYKSTLLGTDSSIQVYPAQSWQHHPWPYKSTRLGSDARALTQVLMSCEGSMLHPAKLQGDLVLFSNCLVFAPTAGTHLPRRYAGAYCIGLCCRYGSAYRICLRRRYGACIPWIQSTSVDRDACSVCHREWHSFGAGLAYGAMGPRVYCYGEAGTDLLHNAVPALVRTSRMLTYHRWY